MTLHPTRRWQHSSDWRWLAALLSIAVLAWCAANNCWTKEAWATPLAYEGDSLAQLATTKAFGTGEVYPVLPRYPASLGAPFVANWNDLPLAAQGIFVWCGLLARFFGIMIGSNLAVLSAHLLAAASFYLTSRLLRYEKMWSAAGAFLFSMSHFAFARSLPHLTLAFYWHIPLGLLVVWWCGRSAPLHENRWRILFCVAVAILHGIQNVYYAAIFLQFLVLAGGVCLIRRAPWFRVVFPLLLAAIVFATCLLLVSPTIYQRISEGPNLQAVTRSYAGLEEYALKPQELLLPFPHRIPALRVWVRKAYRDQIPALGESAAVYLGAIGIAGLCALAFSTILAVVNYSGRKVPWEAGLVLWVFVYSVVGGVNGLLGVFGMVFLRGTNRYSIVIFALILLFLVRQLTWLTQRWNRFAVLTCAVVLSAIGFLDQTPTPPTAESVAKISQQIGADAELVATLEAKLPERAMIFELPVVDFPESPPVHAMGGYEHLRPYIYSRALRFSYGSVKGRMREGWQRDVEKIAPKVLARLLERYGFSAILINKKAYEDKAEALLSDLRAADRAIILAESADLISLALVPDSHPGLPPAFDANWHEFEANPQESWRWSRGNASIILFNADSREKSVHLEFRLGTLQPRQVDLYVGTRKIYSAQITASTVPLAVDLPVMLLPGPNEFHFRTDQPAELPGTGDLRKVAFQLLDFSSPEK